MEEPETLPLRAAAAPCDGCILEVPAGERSMPLLVVLHGDNETASLEASRWRTAAQQRGWALLSLQCPVDKGCAAQSWWKWVGTADWVIEQAKAVEKQHAIDGSRVYLAGWSGGASFIGMHAGQWDSTFAAVVAHGGGQPPHDDACPKRPLPAYFLVGDANPSHGAAKNLKAYFDKCGDEVTWDLLPGADHAHEDAALDGDKALAITSWLDDHARSVIASN